MDFFFFFHITNIAWHMQPSAGNPVVSGGARDASNATDRRGGPCNRGAFPKTSP